MLDHIVGAWPLWAIVFFGSCMFAVLISIRGDRELEKPVSGEPVQRAAGILCVSSDLPLLVVACVIGLFSFVLLTVSGGVWLWRNVFAAMVQFGG